MKFMNVQIINKTTNSAADGEKICMGTKRVETAGPPSGLKTRRACKYMIRREKLLIKSKIEFFCSS